jgi:putative ABC transport system substrate-binding protein
MRRRDFVTGFGAAALLPHGGLAQRVPVVGFLSGRSPADSESLIAAFARGLEEAGYRIGSNVRVEYRWADSRAELATLQGELLRQQPAAIVLVGGAAEPLTRSNASVPTVFVTAEDPVSRRWIKSFDQPNGNATGVTLLSQDLELKRLELLHELLPQAKAIGVVVNSARGNSNAPEITRTAAALGLSADVVSCETEAGFELAFARMSNFHIDAALITADAFFNSRRKALADAAARHAIPALYHAPDIARAGGLISYGASVADAYHQVGVYVAKILSGAKPRDLPVLQPAKFEFVLNLKAARALHLDVPPALLARADEVIE